MVMTHYLPNAEREVKFIFIYVFILLLILLLNPVEDTPVTLWYFSLTAHGIMIKDGKNQRHTLGGLSLWLDLNSLIQMTGNEIQKYLGHDKSAGIWGTMTDSMIV